MEPVRRGTRGTPRTGHVMAGALAVLMVELSTREDADVDWLVASEKQNAASESTMLRWLEWASALQAVLVDGTPVAAVGLQPEVPAELLVMRGVLVAGRGEAVRVEILVARPARLPLLRVLLVLEGLLVGACVGRKRLGLVRISLSRQTVSPIKSE